MPVEHREGPQTAKRAQVQAAVLQATERLLADGAKFAELDVGSIATAAGISRTAFYFYFKDKRDLLMRLAGDVSEQLYEQADIWFSGSGDHVAEVREALRRIHGLYEEHGVLLRAITEVSTYDEEIATFWRGLLNRFVDPTVARIDEAGSAPGPARATAFALVWMTERTFYENLVQGEPLPGDEVVDALAGIWARSVYGT